MKSFFNGPFKDYTPDWYIEVGLVVLQTMVINACMPIVNALKGFLVPVAKQKLDSSFTDDQYRTKCTSLAKYKEIYGGDEYLIHFKYSDVLVIVYVSCMYGLGIPLLFPIGALNLGITYISERI